MTISQVQYVLAVSRYGSFSEAAQHLYISQPSLSQQIRNLEAELDYNLFTRTPHGVTLTKAGKTFCQHAEHAVDCWENFEKLVCPGKAHSRRHLRIGMGSRVYSNGLFDDVIRFFDRNPEIEVTFIAEAGQDFLVGLRSGVLDLTLDRLPPMDAPSGQDDIASCKLFCERQCILMAPGDPRRTLPGITFADLEGCTMMTGLENSMEDRILRDTCRRHNISLKRVYRSDSIDTVMALVRSGKGIISGPQSFAAYYSVAAVPLLPETDVYLEFICLKKNEKQRDIARFRAFMQDVCRKKLGCQ